MKFHNNILKFILVTSLLIFFNININGQNYLQKYNQLVYKSNETNSLKSILKLSKSGNSVNFMVLSLNINNRNLLFQKFKESKYLQENREIINNIISSAVINANGEYTWVTKSSTKSLNGKEVQLYEGYLVKYIAEYCYLGSVLGYDYSKELNITKNIFFKWYNQSIKKYGDNTSLLTSRLHMGSHWALTAQYLLKIDPNAANQGKYKNLINEYNSLLKKNIKMTNNKSYLWNSTYDNVMGKMKKNSTTITQDVAHGNHVVLYILTSYELHDKIWKYEDINKLISTLKNTIYNSKNNFFYDQLDKKAPQENELLETGRRQSDGWMKLMKYDKSLYKLYNKFYNGNPKILDKSIYNTQFYTQMILNQNDISKN